jgi:hypothetical protein
MRRAYIILLIFLLGFGCIEDRFFPSDKSETLLTNVSKDFDEDGIIDYSIYTFNPIAKSDAGITVQRQVTVTTFTTGTYTAVDPNLTDVDLLIADQGLDEFSKSRFQSDSACSKNIGLLNVVCSDVTTCSRLCSTSVKCKEIAANYDEVLAGSMISYVQDNNEIRSLILDARRMVLDLRTTTDEERNIFLGKTRDMLGRVASINANPLYTHSVIKLCEPSDFGLNYLVGAAQKIGTYDTAPDYYHYRIIIAITPTANNDGELGTEVLGVGITDMVPQTVVQQAGQISSIQDLLAEEEGGWVLVNWNSPKHSEEGYVFEYEFTSTKSPAVLLSSLKSPGITIRNADLGGLIPTNMVYEILYSILKNYYMALGAAIGITIAVIFFIYNLVVLAMTVLGEKTAGSSVTAGFRKAFGRTAVRYKSDAIVAVVFLAAGFYISTFQAIQPTTPPGILDAIGFLIKSAFGTLGLGLTLIGVVMAYFAVENLSKIIILERAYGIVIRQEKDMYLAKAGKIKEYMQELETLINKFTQEDFDVSKEYDVLTSLKSQDIEALTKNINPRTKTMIDDKLSAVESAVSSLKQRKRLADENWSKWQDNITKLLEEQNEVYASSLVTIPASLRPWAINKYFKEAEGESIVLEHDGLKKKKISMEGVIHDMINKGLLRGAVVIRQDSIKHAEFAEGSGTVTKALLLKLRTYMKSLAKKLGQHAPQSFISVGTKEVLLYMKDRSGESFIVVSRGKFNEALEHWKGKMQLLEKG